MEILMKINDITKKIEKDFPLLNAFDFDNTGLNILVNNSDIKGILVCLDVTLDAIEYAKENDINLIISHHPLIFTPIKCLLNDTVSVRIKELVLNNISAYCIHTNFDVNTKMGMGKLFVNKLFRNDEIKSHRYLDEYNNGTALGDVIVLKKPISFVSLKDRVFKKFSISEEQGSYYDFSGKPVSKIVIIPGSGSADTNKAIAYGCDCYISSDIKHNNIIDLKDAKISYINPTHYAMENIFVPFMVKYLKKINNKINIHMLNIL